MNKAEKAGAELRGMDDLAALDSPVHRLSPLTKLIVTLVYIVVTASFHKYDLTGLFVMVIFPVVGYQFSFIPVKTCFQKLRMILPLICAVGLFNPLLDRDTLFCWGSFGVSGGVISMLTLMMKGCFCLMASFLLAATTPIEEICYALRRIHVPKLLTSLLLLTFRYISVLLDEVAVMTTAYHLRAPGQRGIHISAWGSFLGQLLLRSMDRAEALYDSMLLRGYHGEFYVGREETGRISSVLAAVVCVGLILLVRTVDLSVLLGSVFL